MSLHFHISLDETYFKYATSYKPAVYIRYALELSKVSQISI